MCGDRKDLLHSKWFTSPIAHIRSAFLDWRVNPTLLEATTSEF